LVVLRGAGLVGPRVHFSGGLNRVAPDERERRWRSIVGYWGRGFSTAQISRLTNITDSTASNEIQAMRRAGDPRILEADEARRRREPVIKDRSMLVCEREENRVREAFGMSSAELNVANRSWMRDHGFVFSRVKGGGKKIQITVLSSGRRLPGLNS
jgi:hypothetical protein